MGGLGLTTVALFIYILFIPFTTGEEPDVSESQCVYGVKSHPPFHSIVPGVNPQCFHPSFLCVVPLPRHLVTNSNCVFSPLQTLTASIVTGWLTAVTVLGQWSSLGYIRAIIGGTLPLGTPDVILADPYSHHGSVCRLRVDFWSSWTHSRPQVETQTPNSLAVANPTLY